MKKLTEKEFKRLLRKAVARQDARIFSEDDLFRAGAELGIDRPTVESLLADNRRRRIPPVKPKPEGSAIALQASDDELVIHIPPCGRRGPTLTIVFAALTAWLIAIPWTWIALRRHDGVVIFSVPSWIGAIIGTIVVTRLLFQKTTLILREEDGELIRNVGPITRRVRFELSQLTIDWNDGSGTMLRDRNTMFPFVDMHEGTHRHRLMFGYSRPEQQWVISEVAKWVAENV